MKKFKLIIVLALFFLPFFVLANGTEEVFKARVLEIIEQKENELSDGSMEVQQNLKLIGLEGELENKEFTFKGIDEFGVVKSSLYKKGDRVLAVASYDDLGNVNFYILDYVRGGIVLWLFGIFACVLLLVGRGKGFRSIISLFLTFLIIIKFIIPQILNGESILLITTAGGLLVLLAIIYITEGFNKRSHIAILSSVIVLTITILLSFLFVEVTRLSGVASEEIAYLINIGNGVINFKGLLLAGIIIGTLGVMDDVIISQVVTVEQLYKTNPAQSRKEVFSRAYEVGISHISSMTNTLFLAYAGASLPLLVLFVSGESAFSSWGQIINNEAIATEIVRTLAGSIGLICAVPISTVLATLMFKGKSIAK